MNSMTCFEDKLIVQDQTGASLIDRTDLSSVSENTSCDLYKSSQIAFKDNKYVSYGYEQFILYDYDATNKAVIAHTVLGRNIYQTYCQGIDFTNTHVFASCNSGINSTNYLFVKLYNGDNQTIFAIDYPIELQDIYYENGIAYIADNDGKIVQLNVTDATTINYPYGYNDSFMFRNAPRGIAITAVESKTFMSQTPNTGYNPYNSSVYTGLALIEGIEGFVYSYETGIHGIGYESKGNAFEIHKALWKYENDAFNLKETVFISISDSGQVTKTRRTEPQKVTCIKHLMTSPNSVFYAPLEKAF